LGGELEELRGEALGAGDFDRGEDVPAELLAIRFDAAGAETFGHFDVCGVKGVVGGVEGV
jgi:hypothetical protein